MNTSKIIILSITVLVLLSMLLLVAQFLLRKLKTVSDEKVSMQASGIWFITLFLSGALLTSRTVSVFSEAIDNINRIDSAHALMNIFQAGSLLSGLTILWLMIWYFLSNTLSVMITGKKNTLHEAEAGNYIYFLIRGIMLIGFIVCLLPVFELILRTFIPHADVPFYH